MDVTLPARTFDEAASRIRSALAARPPRTLEVPGYRSAGVLVPLLDRPGGPTLLFTRRTERLPHHKGEISFPGGGAAPDEPTVQAALREAEEEVGLSRAAVELLGPLDDVPSSVARYVVSPFVAAVRKPPEVFDHAAGEVSEPFEIPLARLLDPTIRQSTLWDPARLPPEISRALLPERVLHEEVDPETGHWRVWSFHADPAHVVWGLTARILVDLLDRAFPSP
jgi:8-oxo-dGTP pyrophosphatase MutT (NUDIX family)